MGWFSRGGSGIGVYEFSMGDGRVSIGGSFYYDTDGWIAYSGVGQGDWIEFDYDGDDNLTRVVYIPDNSEPDYESIVNNKIR